MNKELLWDYGYSEERFDKLLNKPISKVVFNKKENVLVFVFVSGTPLSFTTSDDCCSSHWIESVEMPDSVDNRSIVQTLDFPMIREEVDMCDVLKSYKTAFVLDNGERITVEYRNRSNGYYGSDLVECVFSGEFLKT